MALRCDMLLSPGTVISVRMGPQALTENVFMKWFSVFSDL
jgi:hypothetical protein